MESVTSAQKTNQPKETPFPLFPPGIPIPTTTIEKAVTATTTATATNVPTPFLIIPKHEPVEECTTPIPTSNNQDVKPIFPNAPRRETLPAPVTAPATAPPSATSCDPSDNANGLYEEFNRVSQLFRTAFAEQQQQQQLRASQQMDSSNDLVLDPNSGAIVPVPPPQEYGGNWNGNDAAGYEGSASSSGGNMTLAKRNRLKELVRVKDLSLKDQRHYREVVRRTRLIYDSLRVLATAEEERRMMLTDWRKARGDLRASTLMKTCGLWLNRDKRIVGAIPGVFVGDVFLYRMELCVVGLHGQTQAGIDYLPASMSSNGEPIATSVIVSGGYEDDMDDGDVIIYSGHGGQDKHSRQVFHQKLEGGNLALERSMHYGIEVRVIRGLRYDGTATAASKVYVYDGLYRIMDCWFDVGKSGFGVYKYKLFRVDGQAKMGSAVLKEACMLRKDPLCFKPVCCLSLDISHRRENVAIRLFNDIDKSNEPLCYEYLPKTNFPPMVFHQTGNAMGCECVDGCVEGCFCAMKNGGEFPYNQSGILLRGKPIIFECGPFCRCPPHCRNRVAQKGLKSRLEVFRSRETGWGVRSLDLIQAGAFICEYTGVILTRQQAQILTMNGDALIYPNRFTDRWAEWGDISLINSNYVRPSFPSIPPLDFALDVSRLRNVACYMSHSTSPNVLVQFVLYDHNNLMFPHLMLFAMESIPPMRELSLDYGVTDDWTGKLAICN